MSVATDTTKRRSSDALLFWIRPRIRVRGKLFAGMAVGEALSNFRVMTGAGVTQRSPEREKIRVPDLLRGKCVS